MAPQANTTEESVGEDETRESKTGPRNNNHKVFKSSKDPTAHLAGLTYLIVDDSRFNRKIVREALSLFGVRRTRDAKDAIEAMKILSKETIDLVLTDYEMPLVTGVELTRMIRKSKEALNPELPVIIISGQTNPAVKREMMSLGATAYLEKPLNFEQLLGELSYHIDLSMTPEPPDAASLAVESQM